MIDRMSRYWSVQSIVSLPFVGTVSDNACPQDRTCSSPFVAGRQLWAGGTVYRDRDWGSFGGQHSNLPPFAARHAGVGGEWAGLLGGQLGQSRTLLSPQGSGPDDAGILHPITRHS